MIITLLCTSLTTSVSGTELCQGDGLTLSATSLTGGSISWDLGVVNGVTFDHQLEQLLTRLQVILMMIVISQLKF